MLECVNGIQAYDYIKLTPEEQKKRGILGRLKGVIADGKNETRNGRKYPMSLWEKVFKNPIMVEKIENRACFGELGHPADREEVDIEKVALCLAEIPKKDTTTNKLLGVFDILDTPCGRILKTLCDYGCKIGVSSRGNGEVIKNYDGTETVDEDTYNCECFDAVLVPSVKEARPVYVTESLNSKTLYQSLKESLNSAATSDIRKNMEEALDTLGVDYKDSSSLKEEDAKQTEEEAVDDGDKLVNDLQEALKVNAALSKKVTKLQEQLSVGYAKEVRRDAEVAKLKGVIEQLTENARAHQVNKTQLMSMKEQLDVKAKELREQKKLNSLLKERVKQRVEERCSLNESLSKKASITHDMRVRLNSLNEDYKALKEESSKTINSLTAELNALKDDSKAKNLQYVSKLKESKELARKYRKLSEEAASRYIEVKAKQLGIQPVEIKNKLNENFTFDDVDNVVDSLRSYKLNLNKLPFSVATPNQRITMNESKQSPRTINPDDVLDASFIDLINS